MVLSLTFKVRRTPYDLILSIDQNEIKSIQSELPPQVEQSNSANPANSCQKHPSQLKSG
jgi:hypothetical protein